MPCNRAAPSLTAPSRLMRLRPGVGIQPRLVGLVGRPIDEAGMMLGNEDGPLRDGQMTYALPDGAVFIDVAFIPGLAVGISASIHRIGQNVVDCGISRSDPTDGAHPTSGRLLQWQRQSCGAKPEPHAACGAELGEAFEDRADGAGDRLVRMKQDFTILFSPNETHRQSAAQFTARGLVADAAIEPCANDV